MPGDRADDVTGQIASDKKKSGVLSLHQNGTSELDIK
jgi:hypothetical protein